MSFKVYSFFLFQFKSVSFNCHQYLIFVTLYMHVHVGSIHTHVYACVMHTCIQCTYVYVINYSIYYYNVHGYIQSSTYVEDFERERCDRVRTAEELERMNQMSDHTGIWKSQIDLLTKQLKD